MSHREIGTSLTSSPSSLLSTSEAARYLGVSRAFLERDRWQGPRVPFVKFNRTVRYEREALDAFIARHRRAGRES